jgi:acyl dehydratase
MPTIADAQIQALNDAESSENRIHSDDIAAKYGFTGALVSGVNVFGYLTQPLVKCYGEHWLTQGMMDVIFLKPAYQGELLTIQTADQPMTGNHRRHHLSSAVNQQDVLLARLESWLPQTFPAINQLAYLASGVGLDTREEIRWELIHLQQAAASYLWQPGCTDNKSRVDAQRDESDIYAGENGLIHPYYLLDACNKALMRMFVLPAWIHTGSRLTLRRAIRVGQAIDVRAVPIQKWERKGHQFIKLYIAMWVDEEVALEVEHTAIFKIAS